MAIGAFTTCRELGCLESAWTMPQTLGTTAEFLCVLLLIQLLLLLMEADARPSGAIAGVEGDIWAEAGEDSEVETGEHEIETGIKLDLLNGR